jgi:hypothetical protein
MIAYGLAAPVCLRDKGCSRAKHKRPAARLAVRCHLLQLQSTYDMPCQSQQRRASWIATVNSTFPCQPTEKQLGSRACGGGGGSG